MKRSCLILLAVALSACNRAPPPPPAPPAPPPPPPPAQASAEERLQRMADYLRDQLGERRAVRRAAFDESNALYEQIRRGYQLPETLGAAWDWVTKACDVEDAGAAPAALSWDERLGRAVVAGREPMQLALPLGAGELELAWIEPGAYWMGSPDAEAARRPDEALHEVAIARGFWLGRFEVTQAQWQFIMGTNPSYFAAAGPSAPVEQVSWLDAQRFLVRLNVYLQRGGAPWLGVLFRLPDEAEWEFACRAGTQTATYAGDLVPLGANNCPGLDPIAWYGGNSGVDYAGGWDSSKWTELQVPHTRAGTHAVGLKQPNAWGLHDMLGNVWEWTGDLYRAYPGGLVTPSNELCRVARGGCWGNRATACRAAARNPLPPDARHNRVGLRVVASWDGGF